MTDVLTGGGCYQRWCGAGVGMMLFVVLVSLATLVSMVCRHATGQDGLLGRALLPLQKVVGSINLKPTQTTSLQKCSFALPCMVMDILLREDEDWTVHCQNQVTEWCINYSGHDVIDMVLQ